jgi:hypothetical protein
LGKGGAGEGVQGNGGWQMPEKTRILRIGRRTGPKICRTENLQEMEKYTLTGSSAEASSAWRPASL